MDGAVTTYVYDGPDILLEFDGADDLIARYGHGNRVDQPLTMARDLDASGTFDAGESFYYHADHQGSIVFLTDEAGTIANEYIYDAYGQPLTLSESVSNPYLYTAREFDAESGLYHYRARAYDPETGRFLQEDPIGFSAGDLNLYRYVLNNPTNLNDPNGQRIRPTIQFFVKFLPKRMQDPVMRNMDRTFKRMDRFMKRLDRFIRSWTHKRVARYVLRRV